MAMHRQTEEAVIILDPVGFIRLFEHGEKNRWLDDRAQA